MMMFNMIGSAISGIKGLGATGLKWAGRVGGGFLGWEMLTNDKGKGGGASNMVRAPAEGAIVEQSTLQGINGAIDQMFGQKAGFAGFIGGKLAAFCDFLAWVGFAPAAAWSKSLKDFGRSQMEDMRSERDKMRAEATSFSPLATASNVLSNAMDNPTNTALGAAMAAPLAYAGLSAGKSMLGLGGAAASPKGTPPTTPTGSFGGDPSGGTRSQRINASRHADGLGNNTTSTPHADTKPSSPAIRANEPAAHIDEPKTKGRRFGGAKTNLAIAAITAGAAIYSSKSHGATNEEAAIDAARTLPLADAVEKFAKGDTAGAAKSAAVDAGGLAGTFAGATAGAAGGAVLGSIVPFVGTAVGGVVGGLAGGIAGAIGGSTAVDYAIDSLGSVFNSKAKEISPVSVAAQSPSVAAFKAAAENSNPIVIAPKLVEIPEYDIMGNPTGMRMEPKPLTLGLN